MTQHPLTRFLRTRTLPAAVCACAAVLTLGMAGSVTPPSDLVVHVRGLSHDRGQVVAGLFRSEDNLFKAPYRRVTGRIQQRASALVFPGVPPGSYAVIAFHDENGNNDLDHNLLRLPAEPIGFSNGFALGLFSGPPSFNKLRFEFKDGLKALEVHVD